MIVEALVVVAVSVAVAIARAIAVVAFVFASLAWLLVLGGPFEPNAPGRAS